MRFTAGKFKGHLGAMMSCDPVWSPGPNMGRVPVDVYGGCMKPEGWQTK